MRNKLYNKNYTGFNGKYQLILPLNYEKLNKAYSSKGRKSAVEPKILFIVLTYAYMNNIYSSRKIETACRRDINFMWLLHFV